MYALEVKTATHLFLSNLLFLLRRRVSKVEGERFGHRIGLWSIEALKRYCNISTISLSCDHQLQTNIPQYLLEAVIY